jgi:hypothetical protein
VTQEPSEMKTRRNRSKDLLLRFDEEWTVVKYEWTGGTNWEELSKACLFRFFYVSLCLWIHIHSSSSAVGFAPFGVWEPVLGQENSLMAFFRGKGQKNVKGAFLLLLLFSFFKCQGAIFWGSISWISLS